MILRMEIIPQDHLLDLLIKMEMELQEALKLIIGLVISQVHMVLELVLHILEVLTSYSLLIFYQ